jgi:hypothetical protein
MQNHNKSVSWPNHGFRITHDRNRQAKLAANSGWLPDGWLPDGGLSLAPSVSTTPGLPTTRTGRSPDRPANLNRIKVRIASSYTTAITLLCW